MTLAQYEMLMAVVDNGSFTKAAEGLGCTQSAVSHGIDALEKELGFALITRSRAGVRLTGGGAAPARREEPSQQRRAAQPDCRLHTGAGLRHGAHRRVHLCRRALASGSAEKASSTTTPRWSSY